MKIWYTIAVACCCGLSYTSYDERKEEKPGTR